MRHGLVSAVIIGLLFLGVGVGSGHVSPALAQDKDEDAIKKDLAQLEGEWSMVSGERDGVALPESFVESGKRAAKGNETTVTFGGQLFMKAKFTIDPSKKPKTIDYTITHGPNKGKVQYGIYELTPDSVKFCFAAPEKKRPTEFSTREGDERTLSVWKRIKK